MRGQRNTEVNSLGSANEEKKGAQERVRRKERERESCKRRLTFSYCEKSRNKSGPRVDASHEATIYQKLIIH